MKKTVLILTLLFALLLTGCGSQKGEPAPNEELKPEKQVEETQEEAQTKPTKNQEPVSMKNTLFIGDSRGVGICEYGGLDEVDFFTSVGMSVYNVFDDVVSVPNVGKIALEELLKAKSYDKVYIMLGINEIGYQAEEILKRYSNLLETIKETQPDAKIFVHGNLHVTKERSQSDKIINNPAINRLNASLEKYADDNRIFYLDINALFDDNEGNLDPEKTSDNVHVYAKYYIDWANWLVEETTAKLSEADN